jgi:disulfide bond formation protein DsbB
MHLKPYPRNPLFSKPPMLSNVRLGALIGLTLCIAALGFAYYLEHHAYIQPCPLCLLQRGIYFLLALFFCLWSIPRNTPFWVSRSLSVLVALISVVGIGLAGRQIWLEHLPPGDAPLCSASLERLFDIYPLLEVFRRILTTSGECARVMLRIVGLSLAEWSLVLYEVILLLSLYQWRNAED